MPSFAESASFRALRGVELRLGLGGEAGFELLTPFGERALELARVALDRLAREAFGQREAVAAPRAGHLLIGWDHDRAGHTRLLERVLRKLDGAPGSGSGVSLRATTVRRKPPPASGRAIQLALDSLHKPKTGQDDGGSEGHEEIGRKHAGTIGRAVAQGVSPPSSRYTIPEGVFQNAQVWFSGPRGRALPAQLCRSARSRAAVRASGIHESLTKLERETHANVHVDGPVFAGSGQGDDGFGC